MAWPDLITLDPAVLTGKPVICGTRLAVEFIVGLLGQGWTEDDIRRNYPGVTHEHIAACLQYASEMLKTELGLPACDGPHRLTMRFLASENVPGDAVARLRDAGHDVAWVREDAPGSRDEEVLARAISESRILRTFDKDFGELVEPGGRAPIQQACSTIVRSEPIYAPACLNL